MYGAAIAAYGVVFGALAQSAPPLLCPRPGLLTAAHERTAGASSSSSSARLQQASSPHKPSKLRLKVATKPFTLRLLLTRPALAIFAAQTAGALSEINLVAGAPVLVLQWLVFAILYHEILLTLRWWA